MKRQHALRDRRVFARRFGRLLSSHSLVTACIQKPAAEIVYSFGGDTGSWVIAKNGMNP